MERMVQKIVFGIGLIILFVTEAWCANYSLPSGTLPSSCSKTNSTTVTCSSDITINWNDKLQLTSAVTMIVNGNFTSNKNPNSSDIGNGGTFILQVNGNFTSNQTLHMTGTLNVTGNVSIAQSSTFTGNIVAGGTVTIDSASNLIGNITANSITIKSSGTTVTGLVNSSSTLSLESGTTVNGDVSGTIITTGSPVTINGNVAASTSFVLASGSVVNGSVVAPTITLQSSSGYIRDDATTSDITLGWATRVKGTIYCTNASPSNGCTCVTNYSGIATNVAGYTACQAATILPIADYHFDECSWKGTNGEVKDSSGSGYNGTLKLKTMVLQSGKISRAPTQFNRDSYVEIANFPNITGNMSITGWFNTTDRTVVGQRIFEDDASNSNGYAISVGDGGSGTIRFYDRSQNNSGVIDSDAVIQNNTWYFVAAITDINNSIRTLMVYDSFGTLLSQKTANMNNLSRGTDNGVATIGGEAVGSGEDGNRFRGSLDEIKIFSSVLNLSQIKTIVQNEISGKNYDGSVRNTPACNICQSIKSSYQTTTDGYYYVNEAIASESGLKPFEIYCEGMNTDTNITQYLPTVINQSNSANSNFKFNAIVNSKYYTSTDKTYFKKIEVDSNLSAMGDILQGFSNINLIGTPFQIDLDNTTLGTCNSATDKSKLQIGHYNQAIKIDTKVETQKYCTSSKMPFQQIPNYYAKDAYVNFTTCAQIAQNVSTRPPSGYYLLHKPKQTSGEGNYTVAYCEMNPPVEKQIWTLFLALDAQTTDQKSDVVNGNDTCSKIGYSFFTPNQKIVMEAARSFLYDRKSEWSDYTGTVKAYFDDYGISGWATDGSISLYKPNPIPNGPMWPYGPFGIYKPTGGNGKNSAGNTVTGDKLIATSTTFLSAIDKNDGFGSLDSIGWKSVLPEISPTYEDTWWVADIAAGYARNTSGHLVRVDSSIEPNGDYDANNWLGWFADDNGYIIHYNDQDGTNRYRYSNYMCTSKDMYNIVDTSWDTWGFDAWDITKSISLRTISTKKVAENFSLTIASLNNTNTALSDFNGTVCVRIVDDTNLSLNGNGTSLYFNSIQTQTASNFNITKAVKDARVLLTWKEGVNTTCPLSADGNSTLATDNFAIRPDRFTITNATQAYAGEIFPLDFKAISASSTNSLNYNETKDSSFKISSVIGKAGCASGTFTVSNFSFVDGEKLAVDSNFSDVGDVNITIEEKAGSEFAKIDTSDTSDSNRLITPANLVITVNPYELNVTDANFTASTGQNWLYDANVSDMFVTAHATVQANNMQHVEVLNFTNACYAQPVDLTFLYDVNNTNANTNLSYVTVNGGMVSPATLFSDLNKTITIPTALFTTAHASADYRFNVDRAFNIPLSPIDIALREVQVALPAVSKIVTNRTVGIGQHFYYGRVKTKDITTDKIPVSHLLHVEVYSPTVLNGFYQSSLNWYINGQDDGTTVLVDGNFSENKGFINNQASTSVAIAGSGVFTDGILRFNINNLLGEKNSMIHVDVPYWLWNSNLGDYNNSVGSTCANHPCFNYKYTKDVDAVGIKSGTTSGSSIESDYNASYQKTGVKTFR